MIKQSGREGVSKQTSTRKRPCRICRKWFTPDARLGARQQTCGSKECKRQWHARKCRDWNRKNREYFQAIYLAKRLEACVNDAADQPPLSAGGVQEVIGAQQLVIIQYFTQQLFRRFQEVIERQHAEDKGDRRQLAHTPPARGDSRDGPRPIW
jgi:hypothetical protein